jgi:hypothetical protein
MIEGQHGHCGQDCSHNLHLNNVFTYRLHVLDFTDHNGNLSSADATKVLADHGFTWDDVHACNNGVSWSHLEDNNAEALLAWLGY